MGSVAELASTEVSRCLLGDRKARLDAETCEWSVLDAGGVWRTPGSMCQTDETALILGLSCAWTRGAPFRVAVFDDRDMIGLSARGLQEFFAACAAAVARGDLTQVFVVCNRPEEVPSSWTKVMMETL